MLIKLVIGFVVLVFLFVFILAKVERSIERKKLNNNLKNFKNGNRLR
jgi:uncharacterized membrane protein